MERGSKRLEAAVERDCLRECIAGRAGVAGDGEGG